MKGSSFATTAPWLGLFVSPIAVGMTLLFLSRSHFVGTGAHPFDWLLLMAVGGFSLSLWGFRSAPSPDKTTRIVSIVGLITNTLMALPFFILALMCVSTHQQH